MKIVIDCNVLIAAALTNGTCREVLKHALANHDLYTSEEIILEFIQVAKREKFIKYWALLEKLIVDFADCALCIESESFTYTLPDKDDEKYLFTALTVEADLILTGNAKDFPDKKYENTTILGPRDYKDTYMGLEEY